MIFNGAGFGAGKVVLWLGSVALLLAGAAATGYGQSALDGFDPNANGIVRVVVVQPDGKILIGGDFTTLSPNEGPTVVRNRIARLNPNGTLDLTFNPDANGAVYAIAVQASGEILAGGNFSSIGGQSRNHIARLNATTGLADSFNPNASAPIYAIAIQADGKILAGGLFNGGNSIGGQTRNYLARLDATSGSADALNPNANNQVRAIVVQANGKILVGGSFNTIGGTTRNRIARLEASTGLADSFNPNVDEEDAGVLSIAVQADGKVLAGGVFSSIGGQTRANIARLDTLTGLADSFDPNANSVVYAIAVQADGKILAGGGFNTIGGKARAHFARLDATTGLAEDLYSIVANNLAVYAVAVQADGKVLVGGDFTSLGAKARNRIARMEVNGTPDQTFDPGLTGINGVSISTTAVQPDGKVLVGGKFDSVKGLPRDNVARLNKDGTLDLDFRPSANDDVNAIALQSDGLALIGGSFTTLGGQGAVPRNNIARLNLDGSVDSLFNPNAKYSDPNFPSFIYAIAVQADGKILVGGRFDSIGGQPRAYIARLNPDGTPDSFNPNLGGLVQSIALQADGRILVGGNFTTVNGEPRNRMARLNLDGSLDTVFNPDANGSVFCLAVQPDGRILIGGNFRTIGAQGRDRIARLNAANGAPDSFNPSADNFVRSIVVQADGKILAGGYFTDIGGKALSGLARIDASTGLADSLISGNLGTGTGGIVSIALQADGKILAGGDFTVLGGRTRQGLARLSNDTGALQNLTATDTAVTWMNGGSHPQFARVTFELSNDGANYSFLGHGTATGSDWTLTGLKLPTQQNVYIRARGYYRGGLNNGSDSIQESVRNVFLTAPPTTLANISTRLRVQGGENVLIGGMIVTGTAPKKVIVRARGPALSDFGVPGVLTDPTLELVQGNTVVASNDDWRNSSQQAEIENSGFAPGKDAESAIIATLMPNQNYTAIVRGKNGEAGVGLMEIFDLDHSAFSKLANISTRGFVEVDDSVMIAGLIVGPSGGTNTNVLVRALGPTLGDFGVQGFLANPEVELVNSSGTVIRSNNDWKSSQRAEIEAAQLAPTHDAEAALVQTLTPGAYTAVVRGNGRTTGVGLVEVYNIP